MRKGVNFKATGVAGIKNATDNSEKSAIFVTLKSRIYYTFTVTQKALNSLA